MTYLVAYGATLVTFLGLDLVWLGLVAKSFYRQQLGKLLTDNINVPVAGGFYALYVVGLVVFAILPALHSGRWTTAFFLGAFLGLLAYGTYNLTNLATLRGWPVMLTIVDLTWGTLVSGAAAAVGLWVARHFS